MDDAHEGMIWDMSWHPLGHMLVSGSNDHTTFVFIVFSFAFNQIFCFEYLDDFGHVIDLVIQYLNVVKKAYYYMLHVLNNCIAKNWNMNVQKK